MGSGESKSYITTGEFTAFVGQLSRASNDRMEQVLRKFESNLGQQWINSKSEGLFTAWCQESLDTHEHALTSLATIKAEYGRVNASDKTKEYKEELARLLESQKQLIDKQKERLKVAWSRLKEAHKDTRKANYVCDQTMQRHLKICTTLFVGMRQSVIDEMQRELS